MMQATNAALDEANDSKQDLYPMMRTQQRNFNELTTSSFFQLSMYMLVIKIELASHLVMYNFRKSSACTRTTGSDG